MPGRQVQSNSLFEANFPNHTKMENGHRQRFERERGILDGFCREQGLHHSAKREIVLEEFLGSEHHLTVQELWDALRRRHRSVDIKTVQGTMELLVGAGLARELRLEDGALVYEHAFAHRHHDHLICRKCGSMIEFVSSDIEKMQEEVAGRHGFVVEDHVLSLYGVCKACTSKAKVEPVHEESIEEELVALAALKPGQKGVVRQISGGEGVVRRMAAMNIRPGKVITKVSAMLMGGPVVISIDGRQLAIGHGMAKKVMLGVPWA